MWKRAQMLWQVLWADQDVRQILNGCDRHRLLLLKWPFSFETWCWRTDGESRPTLLSLVTEIAIYTRWLCSQRRPHHCGDLLFQTRQESDKTKLAQITFFHPSQRRPTSQPGIKTAFPYFLDPLDVLSQDSGLTEKLTECVNNLEKAGYNQIVCDLEDWSMEAWSVEMAEWQ